MLLCVRAGSTIFPPHCLPKPIEAIPPARIRRQASNFDCNNIQLDCLIIKQLKPASGHKSRSENWEGCCDWGFWPWARRSCRRIPVAGCNDGGNKDQVNKNGRWMASWLLGDQGETGFAPPEPRRVFFRKAGRAVVSLSAHLFKGRLRESPLPEPKRYLAHPVPHFGIVWSFQKNSGKSTLAWERPRDGFKLETWACGNSLQTSLPWQARTI